MVIQLAWATCSFIGRKTHLLDVLRYWMVYALSAESTRALPECGDPTRLLNDSDTSHVMTKAVTPSPPSDNGG